MVPVDYIFNVVRSVSDLINILAYIFLWFSLVVFAFYVNSKEKYDTLINNIILIWFENNIRLLAYSLAQIPSEKWVFRSYELGRFNFLFASGRLPYFLLITKNYLQIAETNYKKVKTKIHDFFFKKK